MAIHLDTRIIEKVTTITGIVHNDEFPIGVGLRLYRSDRPQDSVWTAICRHNNTDLGAVFIEHRYYRVFTRSKDPYLVCLRRIIRDIQTFTDMPTGTRK